MNLAELPVEVLLDIIGKIDREETKSASIRTTLRLVCRRFNNIINDPNNHRRLSAIRMKINKITIAQFGSALAIRVFNGTPKEQTAHLNRERIYCFPEIPLLKGGMVTPVPWRWEELLTNCQFHFTCDKSEEFFEAFALIISHYEIKRIEFARINITRSFLSSLMECLSGYPRIKCLNFDVLDIKENKNFIKTEFSKDLDVGIMAKFASNFRDLFHFPKQFVTSELIEEWTSEPDTEDFDFFRPIEENEEMTPISLHNFNRLFVFISVKLFTTLAELINAIELRIKIRAFDWQISLSDEEREIRKFMQRNELNYQIVERFYQHDTQEGLKLMKFHKFDGVNYVVYIHFLWNPEAKCYHAMCVNNVYH